MAVTTADFHRLEGSTVLTIATQIAMLPLAVVHEDGEYSVGFIEMAVHKVSVVCSYPGVTNRV